MRRALQVLSALALAAGSVAPSALSGQSIPSPFTYIEAKQEFGFFAGYVGAETGRFGYGPGGGPTYGGRYGIQLSGPLGIELVGGVVDGTRDVIDPNRPREDRVVGEADVLLGMIDARLRLSATGDRAWHGLSPFMVLGAGVAFDLADQSAADELLENRDVFDFGVSFLGTLGLGLRWFVSDHVTLRTDGIFSLWRLSTPPGYSDPDRLFGPVDETEWVSGLGLTAALTYRW